MSETIGYALIDSGCPKTVCGRTWMDTYIESLSLKDAKSIKTEYSYHRYRFGNGETFKSQKSLTIPVYFSKYERSLMKVDVIDLDIPLLLSRATPSPIPHRV